MPDNPKISGMTAATAARFAATTAAFEVSIERDGYAAPAQITWGCLRDFLAGQATGFAAVGR